MTINEYQSLAMTTLNPNLDPKDVLINGVMGLCGESGEAIDIVKKWLAQGHELDKEKLAKELGDIAWYLAETAYALGIPLVVYATTIVRDALKQILASEKSDDEAHEMAEHLTGQAHTDLVVTPRNIDELVAGLADMLALAVNSALQPALSLDDLARYLH